MDHRLTSEQARLALDEIGQRRDQAVAVAQQISFRALLVPAVFLLGGAALMDLPESDLWLVLALAFFPIAGVLAFVARRFGVRARARGTLLRLWLPESAGPRDARGRRELILWAGSWASGLACVVIMLYVWDYAEDRSAWPHTIGATVALGFAVVAVAASRWLWRHWVAPGSPRAQP